MKSANDISIDVYRIYDMLKASYEDAQLAVEIVKNNMDSFNALQMFCITLYLTFHLDYSTFMRYLNLYQVNDLYRDKNGHIEWDRKDENKNTWSDYTELINYKEMELKMGRLHSDKVQVLEQYLKENIWKR